MLVSVIVPVYNCEKYLSKCLKSILNQTYAEIELICVNDGSTDSSADVLWEYAQKDKRVTVIDISHSNAGRARNVGMKESKGDYLLFLDGDDFFEKEMIEKLVQTANDSAPDVVVFGGYRYDTETKTVHNVEYIRENYLADRKKSEYTPEELSKYLFNFHGTYVWNKFFKAEFIRKNEISFMECKRTNDMYFSFISLVKAQKIHVLRERLVYYRVNNAHSLQGTNDETPLDFYFAHQAVKEELVRIEKWEQYKESFLNQFAGSCLYNLFSLKNYEVFEKIYDYLQKSELIKELLDMRTKLYYERDERILCMKEMTALEFRKIQENQ